MNVFTVLTEFRFDVGAAVLESERLQGSVEELSNTANQALFTFQKLSMGIVAQFTGGGGLLGILGTAIQATDKFKQSQLALANILGSTGGGSFIERMQAAEEIMNSINKKAREFALPAEDLLQMTKLLGPMLSSKGLAGPNLSNAVNMSRMFLKSAPTLGVDPGLATGQLLRSVEGGASMNDTLFTRLTVDTKAMKEFFNNTKAFNALQPEKRVAILTAALKEFSSDANVLSGIVNSVSGQIQLLRTNIVGAFSVLKPLGDVLTKPVVEALKGFNNFLSKDVAGMIKNFARGIEPWLASPQSILTTVMALRDFRNVIDMAAFVLKVVVAIEFLHIALGFLGVQIPIITGVLASMSKAIAGLTAMRGGFALAGLQLTGFLGWLNALTAVVSNILAPIAALVLWFEIFQRAFNIAKINSLKSLADAGIEISDIVARFSAMLGIINEGLTGFASMIAPLFEIYVIPIFVKIFDYVSKFFGMVLMGFQGLAFAIMETFNQVKNFFTGKGFKGAEIGTAFDSGMQDMFEKIFGKIEDGEGGVVSMQQNIAKVEINQDFKEQMEPDRVAFTVAKTLTDLARNPTQATGRGFGFSGVGGQ